MLEHGQGTGLGLERPTCSSRLEADRLAVSLGPRGLA
jgi:hypothetical protein